MVLSLKVVTLDFGNFITEVDWNGRVLDSYGRCGKVETPQERMRRGGSAHAPWKASILEWESIYAF